VIKATCSDKLINIGEKISMKHSSRLSLSYCDQHRDEFMKICCFDCTMCFIKSHSGHECTDVNEVSHDFRKQMTAILIMYQQELRNVEICSVLSTNIKNSLRPVSPSFFSPSARSADWQLLHVLLKHQFEVSTDQHCYCTRCSLCPVF